MSGKLIRHEKGWQIKQGVKMEKVVIVGAGPSGLLLAHYLLGRGDRYQVEIYDRLATSTTGSIALTPPCQRC